MTNSPEVSRPNGTLGFSKIIIHLPYYHKIPGFKLIVSIYSYKINTLFEGSQIYSVSCIIE